MLGRLFKGSGGRSGVTVSVYRGEPDVPVTDWATLERWVREFAQGDPNYITVSRVGHDYVQAAGSSGRYVVEWRRPAGRGFEHFTLGRPDRGDPSEETTVFSAAGEISLMGNEVLTPEEVVEVVRGYFESRARPGTYTLRAVQM